MGKRKGFTLIELMVVILIAGILASVAIPLIRGHVESAKWTEGQAGAGTIATSLRAYVAKYAQATQNIQGAGLAGLGLQPSDLYGKYFRIADYSITNAQFTPGATPELTFSIQVAAPVGGEITGGPVTLNQDGVWTGLP